MSTNRTFYRPEIDGLRTIAVLSVIIYHAEFAVSGGTFLPGGFLGVDVFFVISGFLITSLIVNEVAEFGTFSVANFYVRRARRLLPALLLVMLVSSYYAYKYLYAAQLQDFVNSIAASIAFVANIYWHVTLQEYGAESGALKPFLHTWSLAVEEQFYLFYPLLFVLFFKRNQRYTLIGMWVLLIISLLCAHWTTQHYPSFSFFQLPTRLWELLAGAVLAVGCQHHGAGLGSAIDKRPWLANSLATASVMSLVGAMFIITLADHHPGFITAIPVFATAIYIVSARENQLVTKLLSSRPFVGIGLISYSLYLWHYPIFAFARVRGKVFYSIEDKLALIGLTFLLSIITYYLVEKRFRNPAKVKSLPFFFTAGSTILVLGLMLSLFIRADRNQIRFEHLVKLYGDAQFDNHVLKEESVSLIYSRPENVRFKQGSGKTKVVIMGNSHGKDMYNVFAQNMNLFSHYEFEYIGIGIGANDQRFAQKTSGLEWFNQADIVVLSNKFMPATHNYQGDLAVLSTFIDKIQALGKTLVVMSNTVEFSDINDQRVFDWYVKNNEVFKPQELKQLFYKQRVLDIEQRVNPQIKRIATDKGVLYLEKADYMCDHIAQTCDGVTDDGRKAFYDSEHYTLNGAKYFGQKIAEIGWLKLPR